MIPICRATESSRSSSPSDDTKSCPVSTAAGHSKYGSVETTPPRQCCDQQSTRYGKRSSQHLQPGISCCNVRLPPVNKFYQPIHTSDNNYVTTYMSDFDGASVAGYFGKQRRRSFPAVESSAVEEQRSNSFRLPPVDACRVTSSLAGPRACVAVDEICHRLQRQQTTNETDFSGLPEAEHPVVSAAQRVRHRLPPLDHRSGGSGCRNDPRQNKPMPPNSNCCGGQDKGIESDYHSGTCSSARSSLLNKITEDVVDLCCPERLV
jgi:hypothetical protein